MAGAPPLASGGDAPAEADAPAESAGPESGAPTPTTPPGPVLQFRPATAILVFLFILGLLMIFEASVRYGVAGQLVGPVFWPLFGFSGSYPFLTMAIAGILEMLATA